MERNETDIITDRIRKVQTRTVVLTNVNVPSTVFDLTQQIAPRSLPASRESSRREHLRQLRLVQNTELPRLAVWM